MGKKEKLNHLDGKGKKQNTKPKFPKDKVVIAAVVVLVMLMFIAKQKKTEVQVPVNLPENLSDTGLSDENIMSEKLPHLLELGSDSCVPCMMMRPILAELTAEYEGQMVVKFFDVYENPDITRKYNIRGIPTQIFLDSEGEEVSRNVGFMPKDKILERWNSLGYEFTPAPLEQENG